MPRFLPQSLVARVYALYTVTMLAFVGVGLAMFYAVQFRQHIDDAQQAGDMLLEVVSQAISDSAVIGDYDTIQRTLAKGFTRTLFTSASFIDLKGGAVKVQDTPAAASSPPAWLVARVRARLYDVNRVITVGGKDYGVLRLTFASELIAASLWQLLWTSMALAFVSLAGGLLLIAVPLRRWLGTLQRVRSFDSGLASGEVDPSMVLADDAPLEFRQTMEVLSRTANSLQAQRERAAVTLAAIGDGVLTTDASGIVIFANPAASRIFGRSIEQMLGQSLGRLLDLPQDTTSARLSPWHSRTTQIASRPGSALHVDTSLTAIPDRDGQPLGFVLACRDVTEAHELHARLRTELGTREQALLTMRSALAGLLPDAASSRSIDSDDIQAVSGAVALLVREREQSRRALDNQKFALDQHAIVSVTDRSGRLTYANDRFCEVSGYSREELLGHTHELVRSGQHDVMPDSGIRKAVAAGQVWKGEVCNRTKDGRLVWFNTTIVPLTNGVGPADEVITISTDITERKAAEIELRHAKEAAEAANRAKSEFLANMSHEIRTPMNGIIGMTDLALDTELNAEQREYIAIVKSSADSLLNVINDILDFSRIEAGQLLIESVPFDLPTMVDETVRNLSHLAARKHLPLTVQIDPDMPALVTGDPARLRQVLLNLIGNAIKFTERGDITVMASASVVSAERIVARFAVRDTGVGIAPDKTTHIFGAFAQEDASITRKYGGTGLGLSICKRLVELMGGVIDVVSEPGKGSTFEFTATLGLPQPDGDPVAPDSASQPAISESAGLRVLLAEDNPVNQKLAQTLLARLGYSVTVAGNGSMALDTFTSATFDAVLMDMQMPVMDGLEATRRIRQWEQRYADRRTPIIAMTANAMERDREACLQAGMDDHLSKPINRAALAATMARVTGLPVVSAEPTVSQG
ncbi:MAG TPA: ATP-binding protein [Burkholderiaceae bacterium]|nr:ATP-binding protein [Burkholderiaceae bacterium]